MSINFKQSVKCPKCGELHDMTVWSSITVDDSADLKELLLKREINIFRCSSCETSALLPSPLLYHDKDKKLMISFTPCYDKLEKLQLFDNIKKSSKDSGELKSLEDYNLRFVSTYDELLEKILIFDNGLHDKVIECLKVLILTQEPEKAEHRVCVFGKCDDKELEFLIKDNKEGQFYTSKIPMSSYETIKEQLRLSGVKYRSFDWEIIDIDYGSSLLRGVNNNF
ncbi:MAG: CpXC domain-containing protein [Clostridia bacterium]|nr:CpXC domain-containing protein [Clostridia bacterium]